MRATIGAALQEAALDPYLTGREHMKLQTALHGMARAEARERSDALLERVGLVQAADRRVGGYSGGMKRRLDLALALVHRPRILFLDEPTTGLDPQSRTALWEEVQRLAGDRGVTVFLTTQYLEEADVLADRVGIIDHGRIVAEGTPEELKDEIGRPSVEAIPQDPAELQHMKDVLSRFGESVAGSPKGASVRLAGGDAQLAEVVRALDSENIVIQELQLHAPTLDDVFLAKTGRSLEGEADADAASPSPSQQRREPGPAARAPVGGAHAAPAGDGRAVARLPAAAALDQQQRARERHAAAGLPVRQLLPVRARDPVRPGRALRRQQRGHEHGERHRERLPEPPVAHAAATGGADDGPAHRHPRARADPGADVRGRGTRVRRRHRGRPRPGWS